MSEEEWIEKHKDDIEHINDMVEIIELQQKYEPLVLEIISCDPNNFDEIFYKIVDLKIEEFKQLQQENKQLKEVIEEVREEINEYKKIMEDGIEKGAYYSYLGSLQQRLEKLLQILDKAKDVK